MGDGYSIRLGPQGKNGYGDSTPHHTLVAANPVQMHLEHRRALPHDAQKACGMLRSETELHL